MIVAYVIIVGLALAALAAQERIHQREREQWAVERKQLLDRAIARHAGEVIALDRPAKPKGERTEAHLFDGVEGLS